MFLLVVKIQGNFLMGFVVALVRAVAVVVPEHLKAFELSKQADREAEEVDQHPVTEQPLQVVEEEGLFHQPTQQAIFDHPQRAAVSEQQTAVVEYHTVWLGHDPNFVDVVRPTVALAHLRIAAAAVRTAVVDPMVAA